MKLLGCLLALAYLLLVAWAAYIVLTPQGPMPAAPSYLPTEKLWRDR